MKPNVGSLEKNKLRDKKLHAGRGDVGKGIVAGMTGKRLRYRELIADNGLNSVARGQKKQRPAPWQATRGVSKELVFNWHPI